jgi:hypothetical protein
VRAKPDNPLNHWPADVWRAVFIVPSLQFPASVLGGASEVWVCLMPHIWAESAFVFISVRRKLTREHEKSMSRDFLTRNGQMNPQTIAQALGHQSARIALLFYGSVIDEFADRASKETFSKNF